MSWVGSPGARGLRSCWLLAPLLLALPDVTQAKDQHVTFRLGNSQGEPAWRYVSKFGFNTGQGKYYVRVREIWPKSLPDGTELDFEAFMDEEWPTAEAQPDPCKRKKHARRTRRIKLGAHGEWGPFANGTISQNIRPHVWYFAVSDCNGNLANARHTFEFEFQALQPGGSHFSIEMQWALPANVLMVLVLTGFLWSFWRRSRNFKEKVGNLHPVIWMLAAVVLAQYVAQLLHAGHLALYTYNGRGAGFMEIFAEILFMLSQVVQTSLLICIASGYTLTQSECGNFEIVYIVCLLVALLHIAVVLVDKLQDEAAHRFTEHEGVKGFFLLAIRLALYTWFCMSARSTMAKAGSRLSTFLVKFTLASSLYFLAYPATYFIVQIFAPYLRKPIMDFGIMGAQVASDLWLASLFLDRGAYFEASTLGASPLPGAGSPRFFKGE